MFYKNPLPVAVVLLPVAKGGLLTVRRNIPPVGQLALPGGYVDWGETWQQAAAREVHEETGLTVDPNTLEPFHLQSVENGHLLIFALAPHTDDFDPSFSNAEVQGLVLVNQPTQLAFPAHTDALQRYFQTK